MIEILSRRDEMSDLLEKLDEYAAFGVPHIWVLDPRRRKAFTYANGCLREVENALAAAGVGLPLVEIFRGLD